MFQYFVFKKAKHIYNIQSRAYNLHTYLLRYTRMFERTFGMCVTRRKDIYVNIIEGRSSRNDLKLRYICRKQISHYRQSDNRDYVEPFGIKYNIDSCIQFFLNFSFLIFSLLFNPLFLDPSFDKTREENFIRRYSFNNHDDENRSILRRIKHF